jgi:hypothetical protein
MPLRRSIQPTAVLEGTVNDAAPTHAGPKTHGSYHWTFERVLSAALIPVMGGAAVSSGSAYVSCTVLDMRTVYLSLSFSRLSNIDPPISSPVGPFLTSLQF